MFKHIRSYFLSYILLLFLFITSLLVISLIPSTHLKENIGSSVNVLKNEGIYPSVGIPWRKITLDNYTDALMLNTAYSINSAVAFKSSLINKRYYDGSSGKNQLDNLEEIYNKNVEPNTGYERYWHGYLVFLRPLLVVFYYDVIRILNAVLLYSGFLYLLFLTLKKLGKKLTIALLVGFVVVDFFFIWKSLQFSSIFHIAIFSSIYLVLHHKKVQNHYLLFFIVGGLTSFFDLLTAPLITLGLPLICLVYLNKSNVKTVILHCFAWGAGYLLLWLSKWVLVELLFAPGAIQTALKTISSRTISEPDPNFSYLQTIKLNIFQLIGYHKSNKIIVLVTGIITAVFLLRYISFNKKKTRLAVSWIFIGIIPYAWYLIAANHSYLHVWYTYRIQLISVVSLIILATEFINWEKVKKEIKI